jgi:HEAT repeat protein
MRIVSLLLSSLALAILATPVSAQTDQRYKKARDLFRDGGEDTSREAARLCLECNDVEATEIFLDVLGSKGMGPGLPAGHYRDIAWDQMIHITDPYAQARIEFELKKNKDNPWLRAWCAQLLGIYGKQDFAESLGKALRDKDAGVRAAAAEALGQIKFPEKSQLRDKMEKALLKTTKGKDPFERANALIALMRLSPEKWRVTMLQAIDGKNSDTDGGVRCALLGSMPKVDPRGAETISAAAIGDEDWRVRLQAVEHLAAARTKTGIDRLIDVADDGRPRVRLQTLTFLQELTGQSFQRKEIWVNWWKENRATFTFPEGKAGASAKVEGDTVAVYNGIRVDSDHVAFLIDKSAAMREHLSAGGSSKEAFAQKQLAEVLEQLPEGVVFNVYTYELEVAAFKEKEPVELDPRSMKKALKFVEDQRLRGAKDIWQVLERVVSDPHIDTIYLLSSGEPDTGKYVHWNRVTEHLKDLNRFHKVVVHTIVYSNNDWYREQLQKIAEASDGEFKWFE